MVRPRVASTTNRSSAQREHLSVLSSEVLQLRLQALNLPISGSKGQLLARLKTALSGTTGSVRSRNLTARRKTGKSRQRRAPRLAVSRRSPGQILVHPEPSVETLEHVPEQGHSALSDNVSSYSIEDMFGQDDPEEPVTPAQQSFSSPQRTAIEAIVTESVSNALVAFREPENGHVSPPLDQRSRAPGMASPLGLTRPADHHLEDKILHGEYVDLALLLPDNLYPSQTPRTSVTVRRLGPRLPGLLGNYGSEAETRHGYFPEMA